MSAAPTRAPDHRGSRYFLSPVLGCSARCSFCYIHSFDYRQRQVVRNQFGIEDSLAQITTDREFVSGKAGSMLSIGAWGDPFPDDPGLREHSLNWLDAACGLGNPVQITSRCAPPDDVLDHIAQAASYPHQILYSTSLSTVSQWETVERFSASPSDRLETLSRLTARGVATNLMIKPFLPGVTDGDVTAIVNMLQQHNITYCVVGDYFFDDAIERSNTAVIGRSVASDDVAQQAGRPSAGLCR